MEGNVKAVDKPHLTLIFPPQEERISSSALDGKGEGITTHRPANDLRGAALAR